MGNPVQQPQELLNVLAARKATEGARLQLIRARDVLVGHKLLDPAVRQDVASALAAISANLDIVQRACAATEAAVRAASATDMRYPGDVDGDADS